MPGIQRDSKAPLTIGAIILGMVGVAGRGCGKMADDAVRLVKPSSGVVDDIGRHAGSSFDDIGRRAPLTHQLDDAVGNTADDAGRFSSSNADSGGDFATDLTLEAAQFGAESSLDDSQETDPIKLKRAEFEARQKALQQQLRQGLRNNGN